MDAEELLSTEHQEILKGFHRAQITDPIYRDGFESEHNVNPHVFDTNLDIARMNLALKKGPLTDDEKAKLAGMNDELAATPWMRWSAGHHARRYKFLTQ